MWFHTLREKNRDACTTGFRIERMLLVAEKFTDHVAINWSELVNQHKEFVGHTSTSLSFIFPNNTEGA